MGEYRYSSTHLISPGVYNGDTAASCQSHFTPMERDPGVSWIGNWVCPRASPDAVGNRKFLVPMKNQTLTPRLSSL
jgi:hypothetical protein